jgi:hypothetical protein
MNCCVDKCFISQKKSSEKHSLFGLPTICFVLFLEWQLQTNLQAPTACTAKPSQSKWDKTMKLSKIFKKINI